MNIQNFLLMEILERTGTQGIQLNSLHEGVQQIMTSISALQAAAANISSTVDSTATDVAAAVVALNDLAAKVAAGGSVSQADIDAVTATLTSASDNLSTARDSLDAAVAVDDPPVTPTP